MVGERKKERRGDRRREGGKDEGRQEWKNSKEMIEKARRRHQSQAVVVGDN